MRFFFIRYKILIGACTLLLISVYFMSSKIDTDKIYLRSHFYGVLFKFEKSILDMKNSLVNVFINTKNIRQLDKEIDNSELEAFY